MMRDRGRTTRVQAQCLTVVAQTPSSLLATPVFTDIAPRPRVKLNGFA